MCGLAGIAAHILQEDLEKAGIRAMIDIHDLDNGESITKFIQTIGYNNFFVIPLFTTNYKQRAEIPESWLSREVKLIYERLRIHNDSSFYVPVLLNGTPDESIPSSLMNMQSGHAEPDDLYVDFRNQAQQNGSTAYKTNVLRLLIEKLLKPINSNEINEVSRKIMALRLLLAPSSLAPDLAPDPLITFCNMLNPQSAYSAEVSDLPQNYSAAFISALLLNPKTTKKERQHDGCYYVTQHGFICFSPTMSVLNTLVTQNATDEHYVNSHQSLFLETSWLDAPFNGATRTHIMQQSIETLAVAWFNTLPIDNLINQAELKRLSLNFNILKVLLLDPEITHRGILKRLNAPLYYYYYPNGNAPNNQLDHSFNTRYQSNLANINTIENGTTLQQKFHKITNQPLTEISRAQAVVELLKTIDLDTYTDAQAQSLHLEAFQLIGNSEPLLLKELRSIFYEFFIPSTLSNAIRESLRTFYKSKDTQKILTFVGHETVGMLGDVGAKSVAEILCTPNDIQILSLCKNNISANGAQYLADALLHNTTLQVFDIQMNSIRNFGFASLITALYTNEHNPIKALNVSKNNITPDFIEIMPDINFFNALRLEAFYIGHNNLKGCGEYFANMMSTNASLLELDVSNCQINTQGGIQIINMIKVNNHLKFVNLSTNPLGDGIVQSLTEMVYVNRELQFLKLSHCKLTNFCFLNQTPMPLLTAFLNNCSLIDLDLHMGNTIDANRIMTVSQFLVRNAYIRRQNNNIYTPHNQIDLHRNQNEQLGLV